MGVMMIACLPSSSSTVGLGREGMMAAIGGIHPLRPCHHDRPYSLAVCEVVVKSRGVVKSKDKWAKA